jgi:hypothetical protein
LTAARTAATATRVPATTRITATTPSTAAWISASRIAAARVPASASGITSAAGIPPIRGWAGSVGRVRCRRVVRFDDISNLQSLFLRVNLGDLRRADNLCFTRLCFIGRFVLIAFGLGNAW